MKPPAIVLIAHGSPDADWRAPIERVGERVRALAPERDAVVSYMEFAEPTLAAAIEIVAQRGNDVVWVVPAFLSPGGKHIKRDLPALVASVAQRHPDVRIELMPGALGSDEGVIEALALATLRRVQG